MGWYVLTISRGGFQGLTLLVAINTDLLARVIKRVTQGDGWEEHARIFYLHIIFLVCTAQLAKAVLVVFRLGRGPHEVQLFVC